MGRISNQRTQRRLNTTGFKKGSGCLVTKAIRSGELAGTSKDRALLFAFKALSELPDWQILCLSLQDPTGTVLKIIN